MIEYVQTLCGPAPWWLLVCLGVMGVELLLLFILFVVDERRVRKLMRQHGIKL